MRISHQLLVATLVFAFAGCHSKDSNDSPNPIISALILGGAGLIDDYNGPCSPSTNYNTAANQTTVLVGAGGSFVQPVSAQITGASGTNPFTFSATITITGRPAKGTYTSAVSGTTANIVITNASAPTWTATNSSGTYTLKITKIEKLLDTANGSAYEIEGTLDATVPAVTSTGATGTVTAHADLHISS